ncbi:fumarylacetoacetate hydrolase family protein [Burkholderia sp. MR1-5-21]
MKLATFNLDGHEALGIIHDGRIKPIAQAAPQLPRTMIELIACYDDAREELLRLNADGAGWLDLAQVRLRAPIARPGKILGIGLNYADHVAETGREVPKEPVWFIKASTCVAGPHDLIQIPKASPESVDYEAEMVVVIGRGGRNITREQAPQAVFGYCVGNDVSVREWQRHSPQWCVGKSFDTHGPCGPWITLADEIPDPHALNIRCLVNDEERQRSNTKHLIFDVWAQIEYLSKAMTLEPGDLIYTGTPGGIGWMHKPPRVLRAGDVVRCEVERLGHIEGTCAPE